MRTSARGTVVLADAAVEEGDLPSGATGQALVVSHDDDGDPVAMKLIEQAENLIAGDGIELARRFVRQDQRRAVGERPGDRDPLHFSAGKLSGPMVDPVTEPDIGKEFPGPGELGGLFEAVGFHGVEWRLLTGGIAALHSGVA